jgi:hypothetical protein
MGTKLYIYKSLVLLQYNVQFTLLHPKLAIGKSRSRSFESLHFVGQAAGDFISAILFPFMGP